jgi:inositol monophosphatase 3
MRLRVRLILAGLGFLILFVGMLKFLSSDLEEAEMVNNNAQRKRLNNEQSAIQINLNELFYMGDCLLREAGKRIVDIRKKVDFKADRKKDDSVVTRADLESHTIIVHTLEHKFKRLRVHSEESGANSPAVDLNYYVKACDTYEKKTTDYYTSIENIQVWIDPLDATQEYSGKNSF